MGTRGAFGVIIGETEKIGYNQYDSYPGGLGLENLQVLRKADMEQFRRLAEAAQVVDESRKPTEEEVLALREFTNVKVADQSLDDWYCLTRETHGSIAFMLDCGFILDNHEFPLDSLFCEWAYIVDLDRNVFEVYEGFQESRPTTGRWAGRPTAEEEAANHKAHVEWCAKNGRDPWMPEVSPYKAVKLIASWSLDALPSDEHFLACCGEPVAATASQI